MKNRKYQMHRFAFYDRSAIQVHAEKMAAQGWLVEKPGSLLWQYRRIQPRKLHIAVTYFPNASDFDPGPTEGQRQMEEYCAKDGWFPAAQWGQMLIFYNETEHPVPIETDAVVQVETVHRCMRRSVLPTQCFMLVLCFCELMFTGRRLMSHPVDFLSTPSSLYMFPFWLLLLLLALLELYFYYRWYGKARSSAENGVFLVFPSHQTADAILLAASVSMFIPAVGSFATGQQAALLWLGILAVIIFAVNKIKSRMKRIGISRRTSMTVTMAVSLVLTFVLMSCMTIAIIRYGRYDGRVPTGTYERYGRTFNVYHDYLPLRIEDLAEAVDLPEVKDLAEAEAWEEIKDMDWSLEQRQNETIFLSNTEYRQRPLTEKTSVPGLQYTVTEIKVPFLYDICKNDLIQSRKDEVKDGTLLLRDSYVPVDAAPWGAEAAYRHYFSSSLLNRYLLCYENRIVEISFDWEPTARQMALVSEALNGT